MVCHTQILVTMSLVNCCVVNKTTNRTVFPWSILSTGASGVTVKQFFGDSIATRLNVTDRLELESAFLGKSKDALDEIDITLTLDTAVPLFSPFLRFHTHSAPKRTKTLPFSGSVQHVKNVDTMLQCDECNMWRLLYCRYKLSNKEKADLGAALQDISFTCGAQLRDLELPGGLNEVYTRRIACEEPIERLYYSAKYASICVYCAADVDSVPKESTPNVQTVLTNLQYSNDCFLSVSL